MIISSVGLPKPTFPKLFLHSVLDGDIRKASPDINLAAVMNSVFFHHRQIEEQYKSYPPTGHEILQILVKSYNTAVLHTKGGTCRVVDSDLIHGHFGLEQSFCIKRNWKSLPESFRSWAKGKRLWAWQEVGWGHDYQLGVPCLNCEPDNPAEPDVDWLNIGSFWKENDPALRELPVA